MSSQNLPPQELRQRAGAIFWGPALPGACHAMERVQLYGRLHCHLSPPAIKEMGLGAACILDSIACMSQRLH